MKGKRTGIDFSKHELIVVDNDHVKIHKLRQPNTSINSCYFINSCGILSVTGDFGNWVFCREFIPSGDERSFVSDGYWLEKMQIASCQKPRSYSSQKTEELIRLELERDEISDKEIEYLNNLLECVEDEHEYIYRSYSECVGYYEDYEFIPIGKELNPWVNCVFDCFDEICRRLKEAKN